MKNFCTFLKKDLRHSFHSAGPALLLGLPLPLLIQFTQDTAVFAWTTVFWLTYFVATTALYFRSFSMEVRNKNFHFITTLKLSKMSFFFSQVLTHILSATFLGFIYTFVLFILWSPSPDLFLRVWGLIILVSIVLAPLGTLLGLLLQAERDFLFSVIYLPLATPVILGAHQLSLEDSSTWLRILMSFGAGSYFFSAFLFDFLFDDLTDQ